MFFEEKRTLLELHFYVSLLPMLKQYTLLFQCKEPKIHRLHDEQEILLKEFLSCFIKPEKLVRKGKNLSGPNMKLLDLRSTETNMPETFIGYEATSILEKLGKKNPLA